MKSDEVPTYIPTTVKNTNKFVHCDFTAFSLKKKVTPVFKNEILTLRAYASFKFCGEFLIDNQL